MQQVSIATFDDKYDVVSPNEVVCTFVSTNRTIAVVNVESTDKAVRIATVAQLVNKSKSHWLSVTGFDVSLEPAPGFLANLKQASKFVKVAGQKLYLVYDTYSQQTLLDLYQSDTTFTKDQVRSIMFQLLMAVYFAHSEYGIVHGDIKLANIVARQAQEEGEMTYAIPTGMEGTFDYFRLPVRVGDYVVKLVDISSSTIISGNATKLPNGVDGPPGPADDVYESPDGDERGFASDLWAIGVCGTFLSTTVDINDVFSADDPIEAFLSKFQASSGFLGFGGTSESELVTSLKAKLGANGLLLIKDLLERDYNDRMDFGLGDNNGYGANNAIFHPFFVLDGSYWKGATSLGQNADFMLTKSHSPPLNDQDLETRTQTYAQINSASGPIAEAVKAVFEGTEDATGLEAYYQEWSQLNPPEKLELDRYTVNDLKAFFDANPLGVTRPANKALKSTWKEAVQMAFEARKAEKERVEAEAARIEQARLEEVARQEEEKRKKIEEDRIRAEQAAQEERQRAEEARLEAERLQTEEANRRAREEQERLAQAERERAQREAEEDAAKQAKERADADAAAAAVAAAKEAKEAEAAEDVLRAPKFPYTVDEVNGWEKDKKPNDLTKETLMLLNPDDVSKITQQKALNVILGVLGGNTKGGTAASKQAQLVTILTGSTQSKQESFDYSKPGSATVPLPGASEVPKAAKTSTLRQEEMRTEIKTLARDILDQSGISATYEKGQVPKTWSNITTEQVNVVAANMSRFAQIFNQLPAQVQQRVRQVYQTASGGYATNADMFTTNGQPLATLAANAKTIPGMQENVSLLPKEKKIDGLDYTKYYVIDRVEKGVWKVDAGLVDRLLRYVHVMVATSVAIENPNFEDARVNLVVGKTSYTPKQVLSSSNDAKRKLATVVKSALAAAALKNLFDAPLLKHHITEFFDNEDALQVGALLKKHWHELRNDDVAFQALRMMRVHPDMQSYTNDPSQADETTTYVGSTAEQQEHFRQALNSMISYIAEEQDDIYKLADASRAFNEFKTY